MRNITGKLIMALVLLSAGLMAQEVEKNTPKNLNVFETPKTNYTFDKVKVKVGGDFALQFQAIDNSNDANSLEDLRHDLNLPTANLRLNVQLAKGVDMQLVSYLSSRNHEESWVKGGFLAINNLDFIQEGLLTDLMSKMTIKVGMDEFNYGDAHYRRTDNARGIYNPFVGNYIMDSFTTEAFGEVTYQNNGWIVVGGITNGMMNQLVLEKEAPYTDNTDNGLSFFGKLAYDKQLDDALRVRIAGSIYKSSGTTNGANLYAGDRAGSRYYYVMEEKDASYRNAFSGRIQPRFSKMTAIQINPFVKYNNTEFFGMYEVVSDSDDEGGEELTQIAAELIQRMGSKDQYYVGARYNQVEGNMSAAAGDIKVTRFNVGAGWFMTKNILTKLEYVHQKYDGDGYEGTNFQGGEFSGVNIEAVISF